MTTGWAKVLGVLAGVASFPLETSLVIKGSLAGPDAWLWVAPFSLEDSLGPRRSLTGSKAFSLAGSFSLPTVLAWLAFLEGSVMGERVLGGAASPNSSALGVVSAWELGGPVICKVGG